MTNLRLPTRFPTRVAFAICAALFAASAQSQTGAVDLGAPVQLPAAARAASAAPAAVAPSSPLRTRGAAPRAHGRRETVSALEGASFHSSAPDRVKPSDKPREKPVKRDDLAPDFSVAVKDTPEHAVDLRGVLKLDGAAVGLVDPAKAKKVSCTNEGSETVFLSASEPNRILLPFPNPHVISTTDLEISKRSNNNNIYVTFAPGVTHAATIWLEPQEGSSVACGLQAIPAKIPAQSIHVVDDTGATGPKAARAEEPDDFLARVQSQLEDALNGRSPAGWSTVNVPVPPIALDGVLVEGARRLSNLREDIYVYTVVNPGPGDVVLDESEFDGPRVEAVSIVPSPLIHARGKTYVAVLARKSATPADAVAPQLVGEAR